MSFPNTIYSGYGFEKVIDATKKYSFGQRMETPDGRLFRYCKAGATTLVAGKLYTGGSGQVADTMYLDKLVCGSAAVGATAVTITTGGTTAVAVGFYDDGWLHTSSSADGGVGEVYRIKSAASAAAASAQSVVSFEDGEKIATIIQGGTTKVGMRKNQYDGLEIYPASTVGIGPLAGVAVSPIPASSFGWIQRRGPAPSYSESGSLMVMSLPVSAGTSAAGAIDKWLGIASSTQVIGTVMTAAGTSKIFGVVDLSIE